MCVIYYTYICTNDYHSGLISNITKRMCY
uniref:Uncharacterized protein n=1 Tax=Anguilla anguilla TaxID=7936 RepID=A0A0E9RCS3_ANGAN